MHGVAFVPAHVNEATEPVDNLGGILSVVLVVGARARPSTSRPVPDERDRPPSDCPWSRRGRRRFILRQRRAENPLYDLHVAGRRAFWVAACAGIIVFGSLMGAPFVGQQYLQNVLGYSSAAGRARDSAGGRRPGRGRAPLGDAGARTGLSVHVAGRLGLFCGWRSSPCFFLWAKGQLLLAGWVTATCSSGSGWLRRHSLVPFADRISPGEARGMASGTAEFQRDLGGALMHRSSGLC